MSQDNNHTSHISLLQRHRELVIKQIADLQETLKGINSLLAPHGNSELFQIDDKVVSLSAPNKNKVGLVTKVTEAFIHVEPLNTKYSAYKKAHKNLIHHRDLHRQSNELVIYTPNFDEIVSSSPVSLEIAASPLSAIKQGKASYRDLPGKPSPSEFHLESSCTLRTKTTTSSSTTSRSSSNSSRHFSTRSLRTKRATSSENTSTFSQHKRKAKSSPIGNNRPGSKIPRTSKSEHCPSPPIRKFASNSPETPSPNTERQLRIQYQIDRGLHYSGSVKPTKRITQATIKRRLKKTEALRKKKLLSKRQKRPSYLTPTRKSPSPTQKQQSPAIDTSSKKPTQPLTVSTRKSSRR